MKNIYEDHDKLETTKAAEFIGIPSRMLVSIRRKGAIPYYRMGHRTIMFKVSDLKKYVANARISKKDVEMFMERAAIVRQETAAKRKKKCT